MLPVLGVILLSVSALLASPPPESAKSRTKPCPATPLHQYLVEGGAALPKIKVLVGDVDYAALLEDRRLGDSALAAKHGLKLAQVRDFRALKPKRVAEVLDVVKGAMAIARGAGLETPAELTLHLAYREATGLSEGGHLHIPYQMAEMDPAAKKVWTKHPKFTRAVIAHEFAHEVFHLSFKKRFPDLDTLRTRTAEDGLKRTQERADEYDRLKKERDATQDKVKVAQLDATLQALKKQVTDQGLAGMWHGRPLDGPYNEFFADVVAVIYARDPEGMRDGMYFTGADKDSRRSAHWRDFDNPGHAEHWREGEEHVALAPARKWLWETHLAQSKDPGGVLRAVFEGIFKEVTERYRTGVWELPPEEMNRRLVERIQAELTRR